MSMISKLKFIGTILHYGKEPTYMKGRSGFGTDICIDIQCGEGDPRGFGYSLYSDTDAHKRDDPVQVVHSGPVWSLTIFIHTSRAVSPATKVFGHRVRCLVDWTEPCRLYSEVRKGHQDPGEATQDCHGTKEARNVYPATILDSSIQKLLSVKMKLFRPTNHFQI